MSGEWGVGSEEWEGGRVMAAAVIAPDACANCEWQTAACQRHLAASAASESSRRGTSRERGAVGGVKKVSCICKFATRSDVFNISSSHRLSLPNIIYWLCFWVCELEFI